MATIVCTGRLGKDAELKTSQGGTKILAFSIADDIGWGDKKRTQWIQCVMFGDRGEKLAPHMTKGSMVEIVGSPFAEGWIAKKRDQDGKQYADAAIKVTVSEIKLHGGGKRHDDDEIPF